MNAEASRVRDLDVWHMRRAMELAEQGRGAVEPNPMVGCVIARGAEIVGEGWHRRFGGAHAEIEALWVAGERARGATAYTTLEPCCHHGKTPPCADALIAAGVGRVVYALEDPFPAVAGGGSAALRAAGVNVECGVLSAAARRLSAPYLKLVQTARPWMIAKWAMTLDGRIATRTGASQWISSPASRSVAHALRGRVDAIVVGVGTALADDPLLTARPPGQRTALRVVVDTHARLPLTSRLAATASETPTLVAVSETAPPDVLRALRDAGCETLLCTGVTHAERLDALWNELGRRRMTNVLVEGGGRLLGALADARAIDEVHAFIAPKLFGGGDAPGPLAGAGVEAVGEAIELDEPCVEQLDRDLYVHGPVRRG